MRKLIITGLCLAAFALGSCGGDDPALTGTPVVGNPGDPGTPTGPQVSSVEVVTSNPQIPSDGGIPATITVFVKDSGNNFVPNVTVGFAASSGGLVITQGTTNANGIATANLTTAGDPTNRTITVTATATDLSGSVNVAVTGSQLSISGPSSLVQGDTATYTIVLADGAGNGIAGETIAVASASGNTLTATSLTTDPTGQAQVDLTATQGGPDTLSAMGLGLMAVRAISISDDSFAFSTPASDTEIVLNDIQPVTVAWLQNAVPQVGRSVNFSTTRGDIVDALGNPLSPPVSMTNGSGEATVFITADNAGRAIISADAVGGPTTALPVEFIATVPAFIEVQANPFTVAPNNQATITATVRDADNNRVKNARVTFSLNDVTGGTLSVGTAETDSLGRAQTFYTASDTTSGNLGVTVTATIESDPSVMDMVQLTVARRELFVAIGTGNEIEKPNIQTYEVPYLVIVTDSEGNGVPDVNVTLDVRSTRYSKGVWVAGLDTWVPFIRATCLDEDENGNGILDPTENDENGNMTIEAGNVVELVGGDALTDAEGKATVTIRYAPLYGAWTEIRLRAQVSVEGTEFAEDLEFILDVLADDVALDRSPPGLLKPPDPAELGTLVPDNVPFKSSPWGYHDDCADER